MDSVRSTAHSIGWMQNVNIMIYTKVELMSTSTSNSVSLIKLGNNDKQPKAGAEYSLYLKKDTGNELIKEKLKTDENGILKLDSLSAGNYYFLETKAPLGYELNESPIEFTIENGSIDILGGSGNKLTPTEGVEQTIDGTFVLSGSKDNPASIRINEPQSGTLNTLSLEWGQGNQGGTADKITYKLGKGTSTDEIQYVESKEQAEQLATEKLKECRDLYQNVKVSASFHQNIELNQIDEVTAFIEKSVTKIWDDNNNQDGLRPAEINVQLYADDKAIGDTVVLNPDNNWEYTFSNLTKFINGREIIYSIKEISILKDYEGKIEIDKDGNFIITNTYHPSSVPPEESTKQDDPNNPNPEVPEQPNDTVQNTQTLKDTVKTGDTTNMAVYMMSLIIILPFLFIGIIMKKRHQS